MLNIAVSELPPLPFQPVTWTRRLLHASALLLEFLAVSAVTLGLFSLISIPVAAAIPAALIWVGFSWGSYDVVSADKDLGELEQLRNPSKTRPPRG